MGLFLFLGGLHGLVVFLALIILISGEFRLLAISDYNSAISSKACVLSRVIAEKEVSMQLPTLPLAAPELIDASSSLYWPYSSD